MRGLRRAHRRDPPRGHACRPVLHELRIQALTSPVHFARRFFTSLDPRGPDPDAEAWVATILQAGELGLWRRMSGPDRRHAVAVARRVTATTAATGAAMVDVAAAALLHDVGKVDSGLGTLARVPATLAGLLARDRAAAGDGAVARYLRHDQIGAALLEAAGGRPLTVCWAREHHLPPDRWTVAPDVGRVLKAADDD